MEKLMYSPLESVFQSTMQREGHTITAYTSGAEFQAFMRRNDDNNNVEDRIILYYDITAPVIQGNIISYGRKLYILVNRETEENDCYYKSSGLACNGVINLNNGNVGNIPCYAFDMKNGLVEQNNIMAVIDGNMEFITESNSLSRQIKIGDTFNEFGRTWKIDNIYYKDGILHLVTEVTTNEKPIEKLEIVIDGLTNTSYSVGDNAKLEATPYLNGAITSGTISWTSSNNATATIDGEGNVSFLSEGNVYFTAYWSEKDYSKKTSTVTVGNGSIEPPVGDYIATISGRNELRLGMPRTYTVTFTDGSGNEVTDVPFSWNVVSDFTVEQVVDGNSIELLVDNEDVVYESFLLQILKEDNTTIYTELEITVIDIF